MQNGLTFPSDHVPNYYLGLKIHRDGRLEKIFNVLTVPGMIFD